MKKLLSYFFLFVYLLAQAGTASPALNGFSDSYEFKKVCKYGKKSYLQEVASEESTYTTANEKPVKKIIPFCKSEVHLVEDFACMVQKPVSEPELLYLVFGYCCFTDINCPPPCFS